MENDILFFKELTRKQIKRNYNLVPADVYKNKDTIVIAPSGTKYRLKLFRSNSTTIKPEYQLIQKAAALGVAPNPIFIHDTLNFFVTQFIERQLVKYLEGRRKVPFELQAQIYCLCARLDAAKVFHYFADPTAIRISDKNRLYITQYELCKPFDDVSLNMTQTLWGFTRQFRKYKLKCEGLYIMYNEFITESYNQEVIELGDNVIPKRPSFNITKPPPRAIAAIARPPPRAIARPPPRTIARPPPRGPRGPRPRGPRGPRPRGPRPRGPRPRGPRGGPRGGPRAKQPPRTFRVSNIADVAETVYEKSEEEPECCNFNDLSVRLAPKKKSKTTAFVPAVKKKKYFQLNTGELAVLKKFVKSRRANSLDLLRELSFKGLALNRTTILAVFRKLYAQLTTMPPEKRKQMKEDGKSESVVLALRLSKFPLLNKRIDVLAFKTMFSSEYDDLLEAADIITGVASSIANSRTLKQLLQIIVQAINQRLKDFASDEKVDFDKYERKGVPMHDILMFMGQNKLTMEIIAEKILESAIASSRLVIDGMEEAGHISIPERIIQPLKRLKTHFKKIISFREELELGVFIDETSSKMSILEESVDRMELQLRSASQYLCESGEWSNIKSGSESFTIITLVEAFTKRWHIIVNNVHKKLKKKPTKPEKTMKNLIEKTTLQRRKSLASMSSADEWDSD